MISVSFDMDGKFFKEMNNLVSYCQGFLEGAKSNMPFLMITIAEKTKEILEQFVDSNARTNPESLHHIYEWYQTGSPEARLFDIEYDITSFGISFNGTLTQSQSVRNGSREPFYDKAKIMEEGVGVTIIPKKSPVLVFEDGGKTVFTSNPVRIENPGGEASRGSFERVFEMFFASYFRQSFLETSGLRYKMNNMTTFTNSLSTGLRVGKGAGISAGASWIKGIGASL